MLEKILFELESIGTSRFRPLPQDLDNILFLSRTYKMLDLSPDHILRPWEELTVP